MMAHKFAEIAFTKAVKQVQSEQNRRVGYALMERDQDANYLLNQREANFIATRDSFYMASVSETNWPYVQHRGGPIGFLNVIDEQTIGFADYSGNRQYISTGNFRNNDRVSLFLMDYPSQTRLKILGRISIINNADTDTLMQLDSTDFRVSVEWGFIIQVEAFDWNCPKYITPRYTEDHIKNLIKPMQAENIALKATLAEYNVNQQHSTGEMLGDGSLKLIVSGVRQLASRVRAFELKDLHGNDLPEVSAGSHIQVPVKLANGKLEWRHYSICSNPSRRDIYEIAVLNEIDGKGGSKAIYQQYQLGLVVACRCPENYFHLQHQAHEAGAIAILIAGGIGITPIKAMAQSLQSKGIPLTIHYAGKNIEEMPFSDRLKKAFGNALSLYSSKENKRLNIKKILLSAGQSDIFYLCGPNRLIDAFIDEARKLNIHPDRLCFERFNAIIDVEAKPITVTLKQSGKVIQVKADETILDAMLAVDVTTIYSCKTGECRSCAVKILAGEVLHLDNALAKEEQNDQKLMCPCVSRAKTSALTLDI